VGILCFSRVGFYILNVMVAIVKADDEEFSMEEYVKELDSIVADVIPGKEDPLA